jgi:acyl carrier protein
MSGLQDNTRMGKDAILRGLLTILNDVTPGWETGLPGTITPETRFGADLAFESIQLVRLVVAIQERFQRQSLPFQELLICDDCVVDDLRVKDVVDFLYLHLNKT